MDAKATRPTWAAAVLPRMPRGRNSSFAGHSDFLLREGSALGQRGDGGRDAPSKWVAERFSLRVAGRRADPGLSAHAPQVPSPPTRAPGKKGGAPGAPGNGARPRLQVPRGRALVSPFPLLKSPAGEKGGRLERDAKRGGRMSGPAARSSTSVINNPETRLRVFKSVQK